MDVLLMIWPLVCGIGIGLLFKGININITHKQEEKKQEPPKYNESLAGMLPPEVQNYYQSTQGQNKF